MDQAAMFKQWEPLACRIATNLWERPWIHRIGTKGDVLQEARVGLLKAIRNFNPKKSGAATFMTFAYACILRHVERRAQSAGVVRFPIQKQIEGLIPPTVHQLPGDYDTEPGEAPGRRTATPDASGLLGDEDERELMRRLVAELPEPLGRSVSLYFGIATGQPLHMTEVGRELGLSTFYAKKLVNRAIAMLAKRFERAERSQRMRWILSRLAPQDAGPWTITEELWAALEPLATEVSPESPFLPPDREFFEKLLFVGRSGVPWREPPHGRRPAAYYRFRRWMSTGRLDRLVGLMGYRPEFADIKRAILNLMTRAVQASGGVNGLPG